MSVRKESYHFGSPIVRQGEPVQGLHFITKWVSSPENTRYSPNAGLMLGQRRKRSSNIKPTLADRLVFAGK